MNRLKLKLKSSLVPSKDVDRIANSEDPDTEGAV